MLDWIIFAYLSVAFAKLVLCLPHIPRVAYVIGRKHGFAPKGYIPPVAVVAIFLGSVVAILFAWPYSLYHEGRRFFVMYSPRTVIRSCLGADRAP